MESFEKSIKEQNLRQQLRVESEFDLSIEESIEKARSGIYKPTKENLKQGRAGERYGNMINGGSTQTVEEGALRESTEDLQKKADSIQEKIDKLGDEYDNLSSFEQQDRRGSYDGKFRTLYKKLDPINEELNKRKKKLSKSEEDTILKAFDNDLLSKDVFEKAGKRAEIGEVRTWHGVQMKKVSSTGNSKQDWQPIKQGEKKSGEQSNEEEQGKLSEDDLKEHAKQSSEQALSNAIKSSPDPIVRQVAHAELARRSKEEKPGDNKGEFPSKEFMSEKEKREEINEKKEIGQKKEEKVDYGITVSDKRGRSTITQESLDRIKEILERYKDKSPESIDNMVANTNQSLSNIQIAAAYQELGIHDKMTGTYSVKQAKKKLAKKDSEKNVQKSIQGIRYF